MVTGRVLPSNKEKRSGNDVGGFPRSEQTLRTMLKRRQRKVVIFPRVGNLCDSHFSPSSETLFVQDQRSVRQQEALTGRLATVRRALLSHHEKGERELSRALFSPPLRSPLETLRHHNNRVTRALPRAAQERDLWPDLLLERPVVARRCSLLAEFDWLLLVFSRGSSCIQSQVRLNGCDQNIKSRVIYEETLRNTDQRMFLTGSVSKCL